MIERTYLFNTSLEAGLRSLGVLEAVFPASLRLGQLIALDHILVQSHDFAPDGPPSLHPASPYRRAEPVVRRALVNRGLDLMVTRGLISKVANARGVRLLGFRRGIIFSGRAPVRLLAATLRQDSMDSQQVRPAT